MRFAVGTLAVILTFLASAEAFAICSDSYLADCGDFKVLSTVCPSFDLKGRPTGGTESFSALFDDAAIGKVTVTAKVSNDQAVYKIQVSEDRLVVVNFSSATLADLKGQAKYTTYEVKNELKTLERNCLVWK